MGKYVVYSPLCKYSTEKLGHQSIQTKLESEHLLVLYLYTGAHIYIQGNGLLLYMNTLQHLVGNTQR